MYGRRRAFGESARRFAKVPDRLGPDETMFIAERDSFYMATVWSTGWPYVQQRGGPKGFLKVIDDRTIAFADFRGTSNLSAQGTSRATIAFR